MSIVVKKEKEEKIVQYNLTFNVRVSDLTNLYPNRAKP